MLANYSNQLEVLRAKVESAKAVDANIRCAYPLNESLDAHYPPVNSTKEITFIAADSSQIVPDRHAAVLYSLINIGVVVFKSGSGNAPDVKTYSDLKYGDELYTNYGMMNDELISLGRDLSERKKLLELGLRISKTSDHVYGWTD